MTANPAVRELRQVVARLAAFEARLAAGHDSEQLLHELDQDLVLARRLVAAARNRAVTGCREHPDGPVDAEVGGCLLCHTRRRAATAGPPHDVSAGAVLAAIEQHGHAEAVRRYGPRPVARALAIAGRTATRKTDGGGVGGSGTPPPQQRPPRAAQGGPGVNAAYAPLMAEQIPHRSLPDRSRLERPGQPHTGPSAGPPQWTPEKQAERLAALAAGATVPPAT